MSSITSDALLGLLNAVNLPALCGCGWAALLATGVAQRRVAGVEVNLEPEHGKEVECRAEVASELEGTVDVEVDISGISKLERPAVNSEFSELVGKEVTLDLRIPFGEEDFMYIKVPAVLLGERERGLGSADEDDEDSEFAPVREWLAYVAVMDKVVWVDFESVLNPGSYSLDTDDGPASLVRSLSNLVTLESDFMFGLSRSTTAPRWRSFLLKPGGMVDNMLEAGSLPVERATPNSKVIAVITGKYKDIQADEANDDLPSSGAFAAAGARNAKADGISAGRYGWEEGSEASSLTPCTSSPNPLTIGPIASGVVGSESADTPLAEPQVA